MQESTFTWVDVLNDSGGTLKGEKCFGYMFDYGWDNDGRWHYHPNLDNNLQIRLPDGSYKSIELLDPYQARVTLGISTCPAGDDTTHLEGPGAPRDKWKLIKTRADNWLS